jgi:hypothetical protein
MDLNMCNDWMTASLCVFLWDGSDQLEERRIALEAIFIPHWELQLGLAKQTQPKALLLLVQLYQKTWTHWSQILIDPAKLPFLV